MKRFKSVYKLQFKKLFNHLFYSGLISFLLINIVGVIKKLYNYGYERISKYQKKRNRVIDQFYTKTFNRSIVYLGKLFEFHYSWRPLIGALGLLVSTTKYLFNILLFGRGSKWINSLSPYFPNNTGLKYISEPKRDFDYHVGLTEFLPELNLIAWLIILSILI